ncbi:hypothetical protein ES702_07880 [subsurface metagenome]
MFKMEKTKIPTKQEAKSEGRALCFKLFLLPEQFTVLEMVRLKEIMRNEGHLDQDRPMGRVGGG